MLLATLWLVGNPIVLRAAGDPLRYVAAAPTGSDSGNDCTRRYNPCATVQRAVNVAASNDEIRVAAGLYTGTVTLNKNLTLRGGFTTTNWTTPDPDQNPTIMDAQGLGRVLYVPSAVSVTVSGFHLTGGNVSGTSATGGGVYNQSGQLTIVDCLIYGNNAAGGSGVGGGVANGIVGSAATLILRDSRLYSNTTDYVGGGLGVVFGTVVVEACEVFSNSAAAGGGVAVTDGSTTIRSSLVYRNRASSPGDGGGIAVSMGTGVVRLENVTVYSNTAARWGGGVYASGAVYITNSLIVSNVASVGGGGVYSGTGGLQTLSSTDFFGNSPDHIGRLGGGSIDPTTFGAGNLIRNPLFVAPQSYNLHLSAASLAIDSGTAAPGVTVDYDGNGRPFGSAMDRGADEYTLAGPCYARLGSGRVYTDVQAAVDASPSEGLVQIAGRCAGVHVRGGLTQTVYVSRSLTLRGGYTVTDWIAPYYGPTVLDAQGLGRVVYITGSTAINLLIENLHVTGGRGAAGAGIYVGHNVNATLQNNVIYRNVATQDGGGVYNLGSYVLMQFNTIYSNTAARGGGVFASDLTSGTLMMLGASAPSFQGIQVSTPPTIPLQLRSGPFDPVAGIPSIPGQLQRAQVAEPGLYLVQFPGPVRDEWVQAMTAAGLEVVTYVPDYGYLVWGDGTALSRLQVAAPLRWSGLYQPFYALHPAFSDPDELPAEVEVVVQVYNHLGAQETVRLIQEASLEVLAAPRAVLNYYNLAVRIPSIRLLWLASLPDVVNVEPFPHFELLDEVQGQILAGNLNGPGTQPSGPGYLAWLQSLGFSTDPDNYPIVDVTDDGIDDGSATPIHADFYVLGSKSNPDRLVYNYNWTSDPLADGLNGHGNINASIVAGYNDRTGFPYEDGNGYNYGLGINPFGRVAGSKVFASDDGWDAGGSGTDIINNTYSLGARISSNSWGCGYPYIVCWGAYDSEAQEYDALVRDARPGVAGNQEMAIVFAAGNDGARSADNNVGTPGTAKNVITVGAAENYRPTWTDGCLAGPTDADSAMDIASFSSRGSTDDGRVKPDIVAPGTHIEGAASQDPGYPGTYPGVCDPSMPSGQTLYAASSGTSHAAPAAAGAASLIYSFYQEHFGGQPPSPAMVKAYMINATRYLNGAGAGGTLPSNDQGYGEIALGTAFDSVPRIVVDQSEVLTGTGDAYEVRGWIADPTRPVRVTLAWTDAPGPTVGDAYVNNLDLEVIVGGQTYRGNVFSGATSVTGGSADLRNNVESVFLPAGQSGEFIVRVLATNIPGDGLPGNGDSTDQDFALVVYNQVQSVTALNNNIVTANRATTAGGGIYADGGEFALNYNDFYANVSSNYGNVVTGATDISVPPGFVNPGAGNFHLAFTSAVINRADPASTLSDDFEGDARPQGTRADIGADESRLFAEVDLGDSPDSPLIVSDLSQVQGKTVTFTHVITNYGDTGSGQDVFTLTLANSSGWNVALLGAASPLTLRLDESRVFSVVVTVPATITMAYNRTTITATSTANPAVFDAAHDYIVRPGLEFVPDHIENADPGEVVTYTHYLTNTGEAPDTFAITFDSSLGWLQYVTPTMVTLAQNEMALVYARVRVADTAPRDLQDVTTLRATSSFGASVFKVVTDTTIANATTGDRYVSAVGGVDTNNNCTRQSTPCATIAYALNQAAWGDAVFVARGVYYETDVSINKKVFLRAGYTFDGNTFSPPTVTDPSTTIIDAHHAGRGLRIQVPGGQPLIEGFTIRNGSSSGIGGAVYVQAGSAPTLTHLAILNSSATRGGGVYVESGSPILQDVTISNTTAISGAGLYVAAGNVTAQQLWIADSTASGLGGGVYHAGGTLTISQTRVSSNTAPIGGGLYSTGGVLNLWNNFVYSNTATSGGGGGVYKGGGTLNLINDTLYGNRAATYGGGVCDNGSTALVISNTIVATNTATTGGGFYRNSAGSLSIDYNDFWGNAAPSFPDSNVATGPHSIAADPRFVAAAAGDLHIAFESPCVDTADPATFLVADIDGERRPTNQGFDIGADELGGCLARVVRYVDNQYVVLGTFGVLQWAIDAAQPSEEVWISGICQGVQPRLVDGRVISQTAFVSKTLTLKGGYNAAFSNDPAVDPLTTTLDARGLGRTLVITGSYVRVSYLTLTGGDASGLGGGPTGGDAGGGLYSANSILRLDARMIISGNQAAYGGGIYLVGGSPVISDTVLVSNTATYGGGLYNAGSSAVANSIGLYDNTATYGGGVYNANTGGLLNVQTVNATGNSAADGGAFYNVGGARLLLQIGVVLSNTANGDGGAFFNAATGVLSVTNTLVAGNTASSRGGGLYNLASSLTVRHVTFYANRANDQGGGIYHDSAATSPIINSTAIVSSTAGGGITSANADPRFDYNDVFGNAGGNYGGNLAAGDGVGNISADPRFVSIDPASGRFLRLLGGSPAEDAGDPASPVLVDIDGEPRPSNRSFDIGADEVGGCFVRINGQPPTYGSIQLAVARSSRITDTLYVAGTCVGVNTFLVGGQPVTQTVFLTRSLGIQGGYTLTNWMVSDPLTNPTTLDALRLGRVVYVTGSLAGTTVISISNIQLRGGFAVNGGAILVGNGVLTVTNSLIYSSTATNGGALYTQGGAAYLVRNQVFSNTASSFGGVAYSAGGVTTLDGNDLRNNTATTAGGAVYHAGGVGWVQNNLIRNNRVPGGSGGGVYNNGTGLTVRHNTFYSNTVTTGSGGGFYTANTNPGLVSNIFMNNTATTAHAIYGPGGFASDYNDVWPAASAYGGGASAGSHSLSLNPLLVNPAGGDLHVRDDSPMIDRGDPAMVLDHDFESDLRPGDQGFDIGADERRSCWARIVRTGVVYASPQLAINRSISGDVIQVTVGECRGVHPYNDGGRIISQTVHVTGSLTLHGGFSRDFTSGGSSGPQSYPDPDATTLNAQGRGRAIFVTSGVTVTLRRFILINGNAAGLGGGPADGNAGGAFYYRGSGGQFEHVDFYSSTAAYGGALYNAGDHLNVLNSWINFNTATSDGGAIYNASGAITLTVDEIQEGTRVYSNTAGNRGGGVYNDSGRVSLLYNDVNRDAVAEITLNRANQGGFLYNRIGQTYMLSNTVFGNSAQEGGALYNYGGRLTLERNDIYDNVAASSGTGGGGLLNASGGTCALDLGNRFHGNDAQGGDGGAIHSSGVLTAWNTLIYGNTALDQGGGIYISSGNPSILHDTFYENEASPGTGWGGAIYIAGGVPTIKNSIFDSNDASAGSAIYGDSGTLDYNDYYPGDADAQVDGSVPVGTNNRNDDPQFVSAAGGDFHLQDGSDLIEQAQPGLGVTRDFENDPRPINTGPDIGADEYNACLAKVERTGAIYGHIQEALDAAALGDRILVAEGTCYESITIDQNITVEGSWKKDFSGRTVYEDGSLRVSSRINALDASRVVTVTSTVGQASIAAIWLVEGNAGNGGGVWSEATNLELSTVTIRDCNAGNGGGVYVAGGATTLSGCKVWFNSASNGGGLYGAGLARVYVTGSYIDSNIALNSGGGIHSVSADFSMVNNSVSSNVAGQYGGGIYVGAGGGLTMTNVVVYDNSATNNGGGLYRDSSGGVILQHDTINDNFAQGDGGGIYNANSSMSVNASIISNNAISTGVGSGVYGAAAVNVAYTLRWNNVYAGSFSVSNELWDDPHFRYSDGSRLSYLSPAIDAVPSSASPIGWDITNDTRPQLCAKDMGVDEYGVHEPRAMTWITSPNPASALVAPGASFTYTFSLRNDSENWTDLSDADSSRGVGTGYTETVTFTLHSSQGWASITALAGGANGSIGPGGQSAVVDIGPTWYGPGQRVDVLVRVDVPPGAYGSLPEDDNTKELTYLSYQARQCPSGGLIGGDSDRAYTLVETRRDVIIAPDNFGAALPGEMITYTHVVTNAGNITDTYDILPSPGFYASAQVIQPESGQVMLTPWQTDTVLLRVIINPEAAGGLTDVSSAIARSTGDPLVEKAAANNTAISYTTGTRHVSLAGQDSLVDESEVTGVNYLDNNCTQPSVAACRTIQQAINQAAAGDLIKIDQGVYADVVTVTVSSQVVTQTAFVNESVILQGGYDRNDWGEDPPNHISHTTTLDPQGQGRALYVAGGVTVTLDRLVIRGGMAEGAGGGVYNAGSNLTLNAVRIYDNSTAGAGGALYHGGGRLVVQNSLLHANLADTDGGAIYVAGGVAILQNDTFYANEADGNGGAVFIAGGSLAVTNTIVATNTSVSGGAIHGSPAAAALAYNLYYGNTVTNTGGTVPTPAPPDVLADPRFVDPSAGPPDLRLLKASPAREAGDPATDTGLLAFDYANNPRLLGLRVDIGAYEYVVEPGVELEPDYARTVSQGALVTYTHTLTNTGDLTDTFTLTWASSRGWGRLITSSPITLTPGITTTVVVTVAVPSGGTGGMVDVTVVTATSGLRTAVFDTAVDTTTVAMVPGLQFAPNRAGSANPGTTITYTHRLTNTGDGPDTFLFTHASSRGWPVAYPASIDVGYGQATTVVVSITVPAGTISGTLDTTVITATSVHSATVSKSVVDTTTVNRVYGVSLLPPTSFRSLDPPATAIHTHMLTNLGNYTDTFNLTRVSSPPPGWTIALTPTAVTLAGGRSAVVTLTVTLPAGSGGLSDVTLITATHSVYPAVRAVVTDTTTANRVVLVTLEPDYVRNVDPGVTVLYTHTLTNQGNGQDTFTVTFTSSLTWPVSLLTPTSVPLGAGQSTNVVVSLTVPLGTDGQSDQIVITATSQTAPSVFDTATDWTNVSAPDITVTPLTLDVLLTVGTSDNRTVTIGNVGAVTLTWSLAESPAVGWLSEAPTNGVVPPSGSTNVTVGFTAPMTAGVYTTTLRIASNDPDEAVVDVSVTLTVVEACIPVTGADFSFAPAAPLVGQTVTFTGTVTAGTPPITYTWNWGDGSPVQTGNPIAHIYGAATTFSVVMTATNACGQSIATRAVVVSSPDIDVSPLALSATLNPSAVTNRTLVIANVGTADLTWSLAESPAVGWLIELPISGTIAPSGSTNVDVQFIAPVTTGVYTTTLRITSDDPDEPVVVVNATLTVTNICIPITGQDFVFTPAAPLIGQTVTFTGSVAQGSSPLTYTWNFDDGSPVQTGNPITHAFAAERTYNVGMTVSNACSTVSIARAVWVYGIPQVQVAPLALDVTLPSGTSDTRLLIVSNATTATGSLLWSVAEIPSVSWLNEEPLNSTLVPGGSSVVTVTFDASSLAAGVYTTTLGVFSNDPDEPVVNVSVVLTVTVVPLQSVVIAGPATGYTSLAYDFTATVAPANATQPITYTWEATDLTAAVHVDGVSDMVGFTWSTGGVKVITVTATNSANSVVATHVITITALPPGCTSPLLGVSISGPTSGYTDTLYTFAAALVPPGATGPVTYTWSPVPASGQGSASATYQWPVTGTYVISLTAENCGGVAQATAMHTIDIVVQPVYRIYLPLVLRNYVRLDAPDLVVTNISVSPPSPPSGQVATVSVTVMNQGTQPVQPGNNFYVDFYVDRVPVQRLVGNIAWGVQGAWFGIGQSRVLTATYVFTQSCTIYAQADTDNSVVEADENNNAFGPVPLNVVVVEIEGVPVEPLPTPVAPPQPSDRPRPTPTPVPQ